MHVEPPTDSGNLEHAGPSYFLRRHVHVCWIKGSSIFLDVQRDRYFALDPAQTQALQGIVKGWRPAQSERMAENQSPATGKQVAEALSRDGLLTQDPAEGKEAASNRAPRAGYRASD